LVVFGIARLLRSEAIDQAVDFRNRKTSYADVKVQIDFEQALELFGEQLLIPAIAHVPIPSGVGIGQEFASLRKFDSGIPS
jgi:hypothetical protein